MAQSMLTGTQIYPRLLHKEKKSPGRKSRKPVKQIATDHRRPQGVQDFVNFAEPKQTLFRRSRNGFGCITEALAPKQI